MLPESTVFWLYHCVVDAFTIRERKGRDFFKRRMRPEKCEAVSQSSNDEVLVPQAAMTGIRNACFAAAAVPVRRPPIPRMRVVMPSWRRRRGPSCEEHQKQRRCPSRTLAAISAIAQVCHDTSAYLCPPRALRTSMTMPGIKMFSNIRIVRKAEAIVGITPDPAKQLHQTTPH